MDPNLDSNNQSTSRGLYSPSSTNSNPKDGHTPSDIELSKECIEGVKKLVENFEHYTVDGFITSFRSNYNSLKLLLLKNVNDPDILFLKSRCYDILESYAKIELTEPQIRREVVSICLNTLMTNSDWDEICHRILKHFLVDPKQFVNLLQVEQFFDYTSRLLNTYPNLHDKDVKRLLIFINVLEMLFSTPLSTKNLVQLLPVLTKVINLNSKDHIDQCYVELVKLSCTSLHLFNTNVKHTVNYTYYINDIYTHLIHLVNNTSSANIAQLTQVINVFIMFVSSVVNKVLFKSIFESEIYDKLYTIAVEEDSLTCNVLLLVHEIVKKIDVEHFNILIFEKCSSLISRYWLSADYKLKELSFNLILVITNHASKLVSNLDENSLNKVYSFSLITFFNAINYVSDMYNIANKFNNGFLSYFKNTINVLLEVILTNYKLLIQLNNVKRIMVVNVLKTFLLVVKIVFQLYGTLSTNKTVKMSKQDEDKNEFLIILDNAVRMLCKTLEYPYTVDGIRTVLPILVYYYLNPDAQFLDNLTRVASDSGSAESVKVTGELDLKDSDGKERQQLLLYVLYSFSKQFPDLFLQQYLSMFVYISNNDGLDKLFKYSYNVFFQTDPPSVKQVKVDDEQVLEKLLDSNIFVGLKYNLDAMKYISQDLSYLIGTLYNYYPNCNGSNGLNSHATPNMKVYFRLLSTIFDHINRNPNYNYIYEQIGTLNKFLNKMLLYFKLADHSNLDLLERSSELAYLDMVENEDLYSFLFTISMRNTNPEYMKMMLKLSNYVFNHVDSDKLLKQALLLVESHAENTNIQDLYYSLSNQIKPAPENIEGFDDDLEEDSTEPYFVKLFLSYIVDKSSEIGGLVLKIFGKLGNLSQKYRINTHIKNNQEFSLAFPSASKKDSTIVSVPVEQGLDSIINALLLNFKTGTVTLKVEDFDTYCGYLLVVMSPVLKYNCSLTQYYLNATSAQSNGNNSYDMDLDGVNGPLNSDKESNQHFDRKQFRYLKKLVKCLCLLLNSGTKLNTLESNEFENLVLFKNVFMDYTFNSSPNENNRENLKLLISLLVSCLDYRATVRSSDYDVEELEDSCVDMLLELFERAVDANMDDAISHYLDSIVLKLNEKSVYKRISCFVLLIHLLKNRFSKYFERYFNYTYNILIYTLLDYNNMNDQFSVDKAKRMWEEDVMIKLLKLLVESDPDPVFENLTSLLNADQMKLRLLAFQLLEEYDNQKLVQYFNTNYKSLEYLEILLLSIKYTQDQNYLNNGLMSLSNYFNNCNEDRFDTVVYLSVLELLVFDEAFEKLFKRVQDDTLEQLFTSLINLTMMSTGLLFDMSYSLLKRIEKFEINENVLLTLQPYIIQLQTIFNNMTVKKLKMFFEIYESDLKFVKESLYDVAATINESKINVSELQMINYFSFFKFLNKIGYNNKPFLKLHITKNNVTTPIMLFQIFENYVYEQGKDSDKDTNGDREARVLDEMKLYDLLYIMDENSVLKNFNRITNQLNESNTNLIYQVLCYFEYLSNTNSFLVPTKEFKNMIKVAVKVSNSDIFLGHYLHKDGCLHSDAVDEPDKRLDDLVFMLISNKCYQLLKLHYSSTMDLLNKYIHTSHYYLTNSNYDLNTFNKFVFDNLDQFNKLHLSKSTYDYLFNSKLMTLMRMVYLVNNKEEMLKGTMLNELMNYVCFKVFKMNSDSESEEPDPLDKFDGTLYQWLGYFVASKLCHLCNINYFLVSLIYKNYINFLKSTQFEYFVTNLQNVPADLFLVMSNAMDSEKEQYVDDFGTFYSLMKTISSNFFGCLCNLTMCESGDKGQVPLVLHMFELFNSPLSIKSSLSTEATGSANGSLSNHNNTPERLNAECNKNLIVSRQMNSAIVVLSSFISHLNGYSNLMYDYFVNLIDYLYKNSGYNYYYNRYTLELVVGIMIILKSNNLKCDMLCLFTVYFRLLTSLRPHVTKYTFSNPKMANKIMYRYNGIVCKVYGYELFDYVSRDVNKSLHNDLMFRLMKNEFPNFDFIVKQLVKLPFFMSQLAHQGLANLRALSEQKTAEDKTNGFLDFVLNVIMNYLEGTGTTESKALTLTASRSNSGESSSPNVNPNQTLNTFNIRDYSSNTEEDDENRLLESLNMASLFVDMAKLINVKSVQSLLNKTVPLLINKMEVTLSVPAYLNRDLNRNFVTFLELCFLMFYRFETQVQKSFLRVVEYLSRYHKKILTNLLFGLYYMTPLVGKSKDQPSKPNADDFAQEEDLEKDTHFDFFDYSGNFVELTSESLEKYIISDLTSTNKRATKISINHSKFETPFNTSTPSSRDLFKYVKYNADNFTFDMVCNILYHTRHLSYPNTTSDYPNHNNEANNSNNEELESSTLYNDLYLRVVLDERFKSVESSVKHKCLAHFFNLNKTSLQSEYCTVHASTYHTLESLFKYNQNCSTLLNTLFTLFEHNIEIGISKNYPRMRSLDGSSMSNEEEYAHVDSVSQINFVCDSSKNDKIKPIVGILKDFRKLSLSYNPNDVQSDNSSSESKVVQASPDMSELELNVDGKLYKSLVKMNEFYKLYLEKYLNLRHASLYVRKMCELHDDFRDLLFSKLFQQLYVNLSEPYRNELIKLIVLFIANKINYIAPNNNLNYHPNQSVITNSNHLTNSDHRQHSNIQPTRPKSRDQSNYSNMDPELLDSKKVVNLVYITVINSYPLIVLPVELIKYVCYYLGGIYYNTCYYLEKLMLTQPLDITKLASILSDIYLKLDLMDMSIGSNRCWVITNETRLALANLQHSKWKQAQREFNQIMEHLSTSGQSSETVAWFDESKLWFNYWLYCTKQLNEWDVIRDISYISNNKMLFQQSNIFLNSYPHLVVITNNTKDNYVLINSDVSNDTDSMDVENILDMNIYNAISRLSKTFSNNPVNLSVLNKQYNKEYHHLRSITKNCVSWLLYYYKNIGANLNNGHVNCMRTTQRVVEINEGISYIKRVTENLSTSQNINESHLINKWRARLPNKSDHPSNWNTLLSFRTIVYTTVKNLLNMPTNTHQQNDNLFLNQDYIWTLVKYSCVTRKSHQLPLMASVLLNKAQKYLISTMNKTSNVGEDYYLLINEKLKQYLSFSVNVPDALKSVISPDFDKLPNKGFETLKAHVTRLKAEAINRNYIYDVHQNQNNPNKRQMPNAIGDIDLACKYMLEALKLQPMLSKNWISWAKFNDNKIDHSLIPVWSKSEQMFPMELYETSIMGYLTAISINPNCHWLLIKRIFTLLSEMHRSINAVSESFKKYSEYVHHCVWLTWLPQLITLLYSQNNIEMFHLLKVLVNKVPQQLYYTIRTEYLSLMANGVGQNGMVMKDESGLIEEKSHNLGDIKNILQILINNNVNLNHNLENFCSLLTNMGKPDVIDEILCAYETIFEECLDLPFHENIPNPMLHCITNKILAKLSSTMDKNNKYEDEQLYNLVYNFTKDFLKAAYSDGSSVSSDNQQINLPCGYVMNKLLDMINALIRYSNTKRKNSTLSYLLNHSICNVSNKLTANSSVPIQLPHLVTNSLDEILKNKNVLAEIHDILYIDPKVVKVRRRNQSVKCIKIITSDGQNHYYSLHPLLRQRQKNEEYLYQMSQLFNFYFKKYNETRRRNVWIPSTVIVPLDPYICLVQDDPRNLTLLNIYNNTVSLSNLLNPPSTPVSAKKKATSVVNSPATVPSSTPSENTMPANPSESELNALNNLITNSKVKNGYETCLLMLVLHKILLEKNITNKLYECYNKYNPGQLSMISGNYEDDRNVGFNYIYKLFKDKQYPWFITWYRKIHQDVLQDAYNKLCNLVPDNILVSQVLSLSIDYQSFINFRMNFTSTYATQAVLSLIFATPYATPSRLVLNTSTGTIKQMDYKLFNRDMEPNKLRVFRLTRNMTNLIGSTCRLGLLPAVMFSVASSIHHFKIDIHAALSAILSGNTLPSKDFGDLKDNSRDYPLTKDKDQSQDKMEDVDEYLSKILNYCTYLRSPSDQEHSTVPINNMITSIIDASTDSSMLGKLKTSYQPWF